MPIMSDFSCDVKENIKRLETSLNVERNFDILQREVVIAGRRAGFFFIDGFVQEDTVEKLIQFFYSLKESDMQSLDTFLEKGFTYFDTAWMYCGFKSENAAKEKGLVRSEGKDYVVQDGDVILFRFNV